jgi:site-specific recombinase XerD
MQVRDAMEEFLASKYDLRFRTREWYRWILEKFSCWCVQEGLELEQVNAVEVRRFLSGLNAQSSHTLHGYAQVVKGLLSFIYLEEGHEELVSAKTIKRIKLPKLEKKRITIFTPAEIETLFEACDMEEATSLRMRNRAILSLLFDCGLRLSEVAYDGDRPEEETGLRMGYIFLKPSESYLVVTGKGGKEREVGMGNKARLALKRYITDYRDKSPSPFVFLSRRGDPLSTRHLGYIVGQLGERAGIKECHPHKFRHTYACRYLLAGGELFKLSILMGHTDIKVTQLYWRAITAMQARQGPSVLDSLQ